MPPPLPRWQLLHIQAQLPPTLGVKGAIFGGTGFGSVKPGTINFNGDGTSFARDITWSSWGGSKAIGHGTADWVWPGWCSACGSVQLKATVVAYDRVSNCGGHSGYKHVTWYFPSRGEYFSSSPWVSYTQNLCKQDASPKIPKQPKTITCSATTFPGGTTGQISGVYFSCNTFKKFVKNVMRHYGHDARFSSHQWWCGSELFKKLHPGAWQSFECTKGDFADVLFSVRPGK